MAAHVIPGPAVKAAFFDRGHVVGNKVIAQVVALIGGAPQLAVVGLIASPTQLRMPCGVDLDELALGRVLKHIGAVKLSGMRVGVVHIGARADGDEHMLAVFAEDYVARPMASACEAARSRECRDNGFRRAGGVQVA
jgi:hypothetical protein